LLRFTPISGLNFLSHATEVADVQTKLHLLRLVTVGLASSLQDSVSHLWAIEHLVAAVSLLASKTSYLFGLHPLTSKE
jgi:hypothetical protein